jgi:hypothetical protein
MNMESETKTDPGEEAGSSPVPCSAFLERAIKNVAKWGKQDLETLGLAIAEETGELCQAILKARWEGGDRERIREEVIDLGALCHQVMLYLDHPPCAACDRGDYQLGHSDHCPKSDPVFIGARERLERHFGSKQNSPDRAPEG